MLDFVAGCHSINGFPASWSSSRWRYWAHLEIIEYSVARLDTVVLSQCGDLIRRQYRTQDTAAIDAKKTKASEKANEKENKKKARNLVSATVLRTRWRCSWGSAHCTIVAVAWARPDRSEDGWAAKEQRCACRMRRRHILLVHSYEESHLRQAWWWTCCRAAACGSD